MADKNTSFNRNIYSLVNYFFNNFIINYNLYWFTLIDYFIISFNFRKIRESTMSNLINILLYKYQYYKYNNFFNEKLMHWKRKEKQDVLCDLIKKLLTNYILSALFNFIILSKRSKIFKVINSLFIINKILRPRI